MSTKFTLDHAEGHHLDLEIFERGKVYLTLIGAAFEARPGVVTAAVPLEVWERLRQVPIDTRSCLWDVDDLEDEALAAENPEVESERAGPGNGD